MDISKSGKWIIVAGLLALVFIFFTSIELYHTMGFYLSLIEAFFCAAFLYMGLVGINSFSDIPFVNEEEYPKLNSAPYMIIPIVALIATAIVISINTDNRLDNLLKEKGIITTARVRDGFTVTRRTRRATTTTATIQITFKLKDGKLFNTGSEVSQEVFDNLARGQGVDIIYLPANPSIFKVIIGNENAQKFGGVPNRNLEFADLEKILTMDKDSVRDYLNTISVYWTTTKENKNYYYANKSKDEVIARVENGSLLYKSSHLVDWKTFLKDVPVTEMKKDTATADKDLSDIILTQKYMIRYTLDVNVDNPAAGVAGLLTIQPL